MKDKKVTVKRVPQRTCVVCRNKTIKRELVRLVRTTCGVEVDPAGKKSGRGAYLCARLQCWESALKGERLERALRTSIKVENRDQLASYARGFSI